MGDRRWSPRAESCGSGCVVTARTLAAGVALGAAVLVASTSAAGQPVASASLRPVEGGRWAVTVESAPVEERICLRPGLYVVAFRVEPGYDGGLAVRHVGSELWAGGGAVRLEDGERWQWSAFWADPGGRGVLTDPPCFTVRILAAAGAESRAVAVRVQFYEVGIGVAW